MGDVRTIRDDARLYLRRIDLIRRRRRGSEAEPAKAIGFMIRRLTLKRPTDAQVLQIINEYLPVKELVGRIIRVPLLSSSAWLKTSMSMFSWRRLSAKANQR